MNLKTPHLLIVDGMSILKTIPGRAASLDGGYAFSFLRSVMAYLKKSETSTIFVCWEGGKGNRESLLPDYKSDRAPSSSSLQRDRRALMEVLPNLGVTQFVLDGYEADDMIAYLCFSTEGIPKVVYSGDTDMLQLVSGEVSVYQKPHKTHTVKDRKLITAANFLEMTTFPSPEAYLLWKCITGDGTDRIPGLYGVGKDVAREWVMGYPIGDVKKAKIDEFQQSAEFARNQKLIDLRLSIQDIPEVETLIQATTPTPDKEYFRRWLTEQKFASLLAKFEENWSLFEKALPAKL